MGRRAIIFARRFFLFSYTSKHNSQYPRFVTATLMMPQL
ncbi:hypothetical protein RB2083_1373 [Rhodobacteraceae bacterium HTCC2083]|nr:hypothetical protein RB2083_1373 [Rhodobacteraceae bacterium HTCC2083]